MSEIYELPTSYKIVKKYIKFTFKNFYSEYIILGKENIPTEGPVIFAANHLNALMDALAVISTTPNNYSTVFLARADMFKNKHMANFLTSTKIMPAFRIRDGIENLGKNKEIFDKCVEVLENNHTLGIMPEGNQELERKIRPLVKGLFRVAFAAQEKIGSAKNVKIIPIGLDYGSLVKSHQHIIINIGEPIDVSEYMAEYAENVAFTTNQIKHELKTRLESLVLNINSDKNYETFENIVMISNTAMLKKLNLSNNTVNLFYARQEIAKKLLEIEHNSNEKLLQLNQLNAEFESVRKKLKLDLKSLEFNNSTFVSKIFSISLLALFFPIFISGFATNILAYYTPTFIRKKLKVKFEGFFTSIEYALSIFTFPLFYSIQAMIAIKAFDLSMWYFILLMGLQFILGKIALSYSSFFQKFMQELYYSKAKNKVEYKKLIELKSEIRKLIIK